MRRIFQVILAAAVVFLTASGSPAQDFSKKINVFTSPAPAGDLTEVPRALIDEKLNATTDLKLRPNVATELYLWVLNPSEDKGNKDFIVEVKDGKDSFAVRTKASIPGNTWKRVKLPKPPAPPAPAAPPAAAPATPTPPPAVEPPPPGTELPLTAAEGKLIFRLLDVNGEELKDADEKPYGLVTTIQLRSPSDYIETPDVKVTPGKGTVALTATVTQKPFAFPGSATIRLNIPPQPILRDSILRDGFYRRTLKFDNSRRFNAQNPAPSVSLSGVIENPVDDAMIYVGVDGIDRAFPYRLTTLGKSADTPLTPDRSPAVRVSRVAAKAVTQPVAKYPVLIEVDNPAAEDTLEVRIRPIGGGKELTETIKLDSIRDIHVWLDTAGPTDGGLLFTTRSRDWIKSLDLSRLQGKLEVEGVLRTSTGEVKSQTPLLVTVDGTPPEKITILPISPELEKGKPLVVSASVNDPDTDVTKATFYLFRRLEDGQIPKDAIMAIGSQSAKNEQVWTANLAVPPDFRGNALVSVVFGNQAGLSSDPPSVQKIEIVDAKPPSGNIAGVVTFGERPQPGVAVSLLDADGKVKTATTTDDKGKFKFEKLVPGSYKLAALKKDSSTGAGAIVPVQVDATHTPEKPAKVTVVLNKIRI